MFGAIAIVIVLLLSPFIITISLAAVAAALGKLLHEDAEDRHQGSTLLETNV
ncbi:hypothetical protein [Candidatus Poriferisodalis sp.]|uniref:hypothetical protein n=1 Tax=Candidatus Poriferisodalis sp. TaxID=3101277 RepID=UPI003B517786